MMREPVPELSIVIPCFNEIENVRAITQAVTREAEQHAASHEIILIDNFSTDGTRDAIRALCAEDRRVRGILNNRNYGQMRSPTHGIYQARGRAVIGMCADFQDPPALIGTLMSLWRGGARIVLAQRRSERASPLLTLARRAGYAVLGRIADYPVLPNVTGFGLFDRTVIDTVSRWHEPEPFFRGMVVESGFPVALVPFDRPERAAGETKNNLASLFSFALSGLAGSAKALLRLPILLSLWAGGIAALLLLAGLVAAVLGGPAWPLLGCAAAGGMFACVLLFLGLIGDQVRLIAERTRGVPLVVEEARINFPDGA
ncbi:glycosyltransferase family 2 protein [Sphingomonas azotifigens]|uniref:glycosyltransferase family 2 protein n=1 Tax=Sphingomonas azotifigens TaxID=330920 RepID=UPI000A01C653|nr:glycosyltransferase family 2 protein [Sphingomonas azotifigens]